MKQLTIIIGVLVMAMCAAYTVQAHPATDVPVVNEITFMWGTDWSPDGRTITFGSKGELYLVDVETKTLSCPTDNIDETCYYPKFSHDGSKLYYSQRAENSTVWSIWVLDLVTLETTLVADNRYAASVSADGGSLIYNVYDGSNFIAHAIHDLATGTETILELDDEAPYYEVSMVELALDNNSYFATFKNFNGVPQHDELNDQYSICHVDIATGERSFLENMPNNSWYPKVSPDGTKLLASKRDFYSKEVPFYQDLIWTVDGKDYTVIEFYQSRYTNCWIKDPDTGEIVRPTLENFWSRPEDQALYAKGPDGTAYLQEGVYLDKTRKVEGSTFNVLVYDLTTNSIIEEFDSGLFETKMASWSPDGTQFCYIMNDSMRNSTLYIYDLEKGVNKLVVNTNGYDGPTSVEEEMAPAPFELAGNYPNPFNPTTTIDFNLHNTGDVMMDVYNVMGQSVRQLVSGRMTAGAHSVVWDGRDDRGEAVSSGVYICRLKMGEQVRAIRMLLTK